MPSIDDSSEYYLFREARERQLASREQDEAIRNLHLEMAEKYADLAREALAAGR